MGFQKEEFLKKYRAVGDFAVADNKYYNAFLQLLDDEDLLKGIKFANDVINVPPIKSFILYYRNVLKSDLFEETMSDNYKQGLGACFGYLFRFMYGGYEPVSVWCGDKSTNVKKASYFKKV